ncbi:hypothetical protein IWQ60_008226 [Tieghemiomyces parasiticus]|uniref:Cytochrome P450 n=1 Tax=Tieghemiomyces parasiticus TaxID=78921 RepID=A0A9W7ZTZ4_9FUNG|nr:hypothetical protein IWQ60_008226 [Tieghemiomyces parasiticus]
MANSAIITLIGSAVGVQITWLGLSLATVLGTLASWVIYHAFLSPLCHVPGPFFCRILPAALHPQLYMGRHYVWVTEMHRRYGPLVRIGHQAVSVIDRASIREIYHGYSHIKARIWYRGLEQYTPGMFTTPHAVVHKQLKRQLEPTFSRKAVREMESLVLEHGAAGLAFTIAGRCAAEAAVAGPKHGETGTVVDLFSLLNYAALDTITQLALGRNACLLRGSDHPIVGWFHSFGMMATLMCAFPFLKDYKFGFRQMRQDAQNLYDHAVECITEKRATLHQIAADRAAGRPIDDQRQAAEKDILANLLGAEDPQTNAKLTEVQIAVETITTMFAGTETISAGLTLTFLHLFRHPNLYRKVQDEIVRSFPVPDLFGDEDGCPTTPRPLGLNLTLLQMMGITYANIKERVPLVEAIINETLRITPSATTVLMREVPEGGRVLGGHYMPAGTNVGMSVMAYHHGAEWEDPHLFQPERFLGPEGEKNLVKLMSFSLGPRQCIGRNLAYVEMSLILVVLLRFFHFEAASSAEMHQDWLEFVTLRPSTLKFHCRTWLRPEFCAA